MPEISRKNLVLLLIGLNESGEMGDAELGGITRLQKYIFLLGEEEGLVPTGDGFQFTAYKKGPYSSKLYDDLEFLHNLDLIDSRIRAVAAEEEAEEVEALTFDFLMGTENEVRRSEEGLAAREDAYEERKFLLTAKGKARVEKLIESEELSAVREGIRKVKSRFVNHSLNDLLYYVYTNHPDMTTESDIKDKVLRRKRKA